MKIYFYFKIFLFFIIIFLTFNNFIFPEKNNNNIDPISPKRYLILDFANPLLSFDTNTNFWFSFNQLISKSNMFIGKKWNFDKNFFGRSFLTIFSLYFSGATNYYSHEISHEFQHHTPIIIDFHSLHFGLFPKYVQKPYNSECFTQIEKSRNALNGLNQNEFSSYFLNEYNLKNKLINFDDSIFFLHTKLGDFFYLLIKGLKFEFSHEKEFCDKNFSWDVNAFRNILYKQNVNLTYNEYLLQILIADFLSLRTWESIFSIGDYLENNIRTRKPIFIKINKNLKFSPPLITHYLTHFGSFYDLNSYVFFKNLVFKINFGIDIDYIGGGLLDTFRFGSQIFSLKIFKFFKVNPYFYLNFKRSSFKCKGISFGVDSFYQFSKKLFLNLRFEYNDNDTLENLIKGEKKGFGLKMGIKIGL